MSTTLIGILLGLGSALCSSLSYLFSRLFVLRHHRAPWRLLVLGHVIIGIASAIALPLLWPAADFNWQPYIPPLLAMTGFYLVAQTLLFIVLRHSDASQIAPLLALKIVLVGGIRMTFYNEVIGLLQWVGVAAAIAGAFILNAGAGRVRWRTIVVVLGMCLCYALSDINILAATTELQRQGHPEPVLFAIASSYSLSGLLGLCLLPWVRGNLREDIRYALPWAAAWMGAMVSLFWCFWLVGVVMGGILQSTRGLISVVLGAVLAAIGLEKLETKHAGHVLIRRIIAAACMTGAIILYQLGK